MRRIPPGMPVRPLRGGSRCSNPARIAGRGLLGRNAGNRISFAGLRHSLVRAIPICGRVCAGIARAIRLARRGFGNTESASLQSAPPGNPGGIIDEQYDEVGSELKEKMPPESTLDFDDRNRASQRSAPHKGAPYNSAYPASEARFPASRLGWRQRVRALPDIRGGCGRQFRWSSGPPAANSHPRHGDTCM
jgi:hypothetical protein